MLSSWDKCLPYGLVIRCNRNSCIKSKPYMIGDPRGTRVSLKPDEKLLPGHCWGRRDKIWSAAMGSHSATLLHTQIWLRWYLAQSVTVPIGRMSLMRSTHEVSLLLKEEMAMTCSFPSGPEDGSWPCTAAKRWIPKHTYARLAFGLDMQIKSFNLLDVVWKISR